MSEVVKSFFEEVMHVCAKHKMLTIYDQSEGKYVFKCYESTSVLESELAAKDTPDLTSVPNSEENPATALKSDNT